MCLISQDLKGASKEKGEENGREGKVLVRVEGALKMESEWAGGKEKTEIWRKCEGKEKKEKKERNEEEEWKETRGIQRGEKDEQWGSRKEWRGKREREEGKQERKAAQKEQDRKRRRDKV